MSEDMSGDFGQPLFSNLTTATNLAHKSTVKDNFKMQVTPFRLLTVL